MSVKHAILGFLAESPKHGYDLKRAFDDKLGDFWSLNVGQIYTTLNRLQDEGLVEYDPIAQSDKPDKKVYRLTPDGLQVLADWRRTPIKSEPRVLRDELFLKLVFMDDPQALLDEIQAHHSAYMAYMMGLTNRKFNIEQQHRRALPTLTDPEAREDAEHDRLISTLLLDVALFHAEADIRWLKHCEAKIKEMMK